MGSTVECGVFAPHLSGKLLVSLFSKSERVWAEPIKRRACFAKLFLCASRAKEKAVLSQAQNKKGCQLTTLFTVYY